MIAVYYMWYMDILWQKFTGQLDTSEHIRFYVQKKVQEHYMDMHLQHINQTLRIIVMFMLLFNVCPTLEQTL